MFYTTFFVVSSIYGQFGEEKTFIDYNKVELPSSPNAAGLGKYGDTPMTFATGIPSISIPIYTLQVDGLSIPISLSYHASGVQVNEFPTAVGLKWTLNAGGAIFRTVKSRPDELGWHSGSDDMGPISDSWYDEEFTVDSATDQLIMTGNPPGDGGYAKFRDHNPDHYSYSILEYSGKFITDFSQEIIKNEADNLFINPSHIGSTEYPVAKDQYGNIYFFNSRTEVSNNKYQSVTQRTGDSHASPNEPADDSNTITGWMLSNIKTKNNDSISFDYETYSIDERNVPRIVSNTIAYGTDCTFGWTKYAERTTTNVYNNFTVELIKKISSDNVDILFDYSLGGSELSLWKKKLTKITINCNVTSTSKEFHFQYGEFSGDRRLKLKRVFEKIGNQELPGYSFEYISGDLPTKYSKSQDFFGYYNGKTNPSLVPWDENTKNTYFSDQPNFYDNHTGDRTHSLPHLQIGALEIIKYPTGGSTKFSYAANAAFDSKIQKIKYCGGLRVEKIENRDRDELVLKKTTYHYEHLVGQSLETDRDNIKTLEFHMGSPFKYIFHSNFAIEEDGIRNGYFYRKVTEVITGKDNHQKTEYNYDEKFSFGTLGHLLQSEKIFTDNEESKTIEYEYGGFGISRTMKWNILGHYLCISNTDSNFFFRGYDKGRRMVYTGNGTLLPTEIITTDYLKAGSSTKEVTNHQYIDYDDETLLKIQEITDTGDEIITTHYKYPWSPGINLPDLPPALPISKIVYSDKQQDGDPIFGQYFEYDSVGNIKRTYQYNKGKVGNTTAPVYIPSNYEEMTNFIFSHGKPVQVSNKDGEPATYIWAYKNRYPVAKVEGTAYNTILNGGHIAAIQQTTDGGSYNEANLITALSNLRNAYPEAMVTTFIYNPLYGVKTITDPKGDEQYFEYDPFGRLERVKDHQKNILSENEYNYAH